MGAALPLGELAFQLVAGAPRPVAHGGMAQAAHLLDEPSLDLVGRADFTFLDLRQPQNRREALPQLRMTPHLPDQNGFLFC